LAQVHFSSSSLSFLDIIQFSNVDMKCSVLSLLALVVHGKKLQHNPAVEELVVNVVQNSQQQANEVAVEQAKQILTAKMFCIAPKDILDGDSDSYMNLKENGLSIADFDVKAECRYGGTAKVSACSVHGGNYVLSGCRSKARSFCMAPKDALDGDSDSYMNLKENSLSMVGFDVKAECKYGGTAKVSACSVHGGNYVLSGCSSKAMSFHTAPKDAPDKAMQATKARQALCIAPRDSDLSDYMSIKETDLFAATFDVKAECKYGGIAKVSACSAQGGHYALSGCRTKAMQTAGDKGLQQAKKIVEAAVRDVETPKVDAGAAEAKKIVAAAVADVEKGKAADAAAEAKAKAAKEAAAAQKMKASTEKSSAQHKGGFLGWLVGW